MKSNNSQNRKLDHLYLDLSKEARMIRMIKECDKLDPLFEQELAEEGMAFEIETWPEF